MAVTDGDEERVVQLLLADVRSTLGRDCEALIRRNAERLREFAGNPDNYFERVIEDTQQDIHDQFIDTDWPRCPCTADTRFGPEKAAGGA